MRLRLLPSPVQAQAIHCRSAGAGIYSAARARNAAVRGSPGPWSPAETIRPSLAGCGDPVLTEQLACGKLWPRPEPLPCASLCAALWFSLPWGRSPLPYCQAAPPDSCPSCHLYPLPIPCLPSKAKVPRPSELCQEGPSGSDAPGSGTLVPCGCLLPSATWASSHPCLSPGSRVSSAHLILHLDDVP